ncbi:helix-turn-helix domain-containing protein [uncultured Bifidobacterium sp.]|uniref:TetR/AcrR family transcriptional regulator n=1 Tax=uncultured Bifidobacterium sp. TaxID=165187 RepID=UPI0028DCDE7D|nr:helix-turn-helix domain-containing protein [uncultured Bifidobacterium sp.]
MVEHRSYAKGIAKRREILSKALSIIGRKGFGETTLKDVAEAVDLSQAGVLHYFHSTDDLFVQIVKARDERRFRLMMRRLKKSGIVAVVNGVPVLGPRDEDDADLLDIIDKLITGLHDTQRTPGLIELFIRMQAASAEPGHPAHEYFLARTAMIHRMFEPVMAEANRRGILQPEWDPTAAVRTITALADGLEIQWLRDRTTDIDGTLWDFFRLVGGGLRRPEEPQDDSEHGDMTATAVDDGDDEEPDAEAPHDDAENGPITGTRPAADRHAAGAGTGRARRGNRTPRA